MSLVPVLIRRLAVVVTAVVRKNDPSNDRNLEVEVTVVVRKIYLSIDLSLEVEVTAVVRKIYLSNDQNLGEANSSKNRMNDLSNDQNLDWMTIVLNRRMRVDWTEMCLDLCFHVLSQGQNLEPTRRLCKSQGHQGLIVGEGFSFAFNRYDELKTD